MGILESITSSFANVLGNKMRSVLTMLGIIIGIGAVIMITSIGDGVKASTSEQLSNLGMESITVSVKRDADTKASDYLKMADVDIVAVPDAVTTVVPIFSAGGTSKLRNGDTKNVSVIGTTRDFPVVQPVTMLLGRMLIEQDVLNRTGVCVIDNDFAVKLFGREDVLGEQLPVTLRSGTKNFDIVGVYKGQNMSMFFDMAASIYVPISTLMELYGATNVDNIYFMVDDQSHADRSIAQVNLLLSNAHRNDGRYQFQNWHDTAGQINDVLNQLTLFVALVASIALAVGGIGIMNIMLVTVTERTREIGIRKSLGATNGNILFQFLVEAMILTVMGGIIGIALGYGGSIVISQFANVVPKMSAFTIAGTVVISSLIGIVFGVYPANKAAGLDPIEALRYE